MDIIRLYRDFGVIHTTEGHKHSRPGWVNTECPFCTGHKGFHLGWNLQDEYYFCWRCGWHPPVKTLSEILKIDYLSVAKLFEQYGINRTAVQQKIVEKKNFKLPSGVSHLKTSHKNYLLERGFDPDKIISDWGVLGTGPVSRLDNLSYRFRILIPFYWNNEMVTFDSRDITGKQQNKYQACPVYYETIGHKKILYGDQENWNPNLGICVEGPTDVWRIGKLAFATSGIQYTREQVRVISSIFKRVAVIFDNEIQAQAQARKLVSELKFRGVDAWIETVRDDPGNMTGREVYELIKKIKEK